MTINNNNYGYAVTFWNGKTEYHKKTEPTNYDHYFQKILVHYILNESAKINGPVHLENEYMALLPEDIRKDLIFSGHLQNGFNWNRLHPILAAIVAFNSTINGDEALFKMELGEFGIRIGLKENYIKYIEQNSRQIF